MTNVVDQIIEKEATTKEREVTYEIYLK